MEHCQERLKFAKDYVGVIRAPRCPKPAIYDDLKHDPKAGFYYFENSQKEALWVAVAGEHINPLTAWFRSAHRALTCSSTVAAALADGPPQIPSVPVDALFIPRQEATPENFDGLFRENYTIYLVHAKEFLVLVPTSKRRLYLGVKTRECVRDLKICRRKPMEPDAKTGIRRPYDPIFKQIQEVTGTIGASASQAASDLAGYWQQVLQEEPPADIRDFELEITETITHIAKLADSTSGEDALAVIDQLAVSLRQKQRAAFELLAAIRDFEWPPTSPTVTYERAATRLMLLAARQYAQDVARKLNLDEYDFIPIVGRDFGVHPGLFAVRVRAHTEYSTVVLEFPAEMRLRLGALPMIAHQVALMRERDIERIADLFDEQQHNLDLRWLFGGPHRYQSDSDEGRERRRQSWIHEMGKQLAADLLATAAVGPQYVYAIARFAVGNLGDFRSAAVPRKQLSLSSRISACLGFLKTHEVSPPFESPYFTDGAQLVPNPILRIVNEAVPGAGQYNNDVGAVAATLCDGRIVDGASPTTILAALWNGVVYQSAYVHEIAALISINSGDRG